MPAKHNGYYPVGRIATTELHYEPDAPWHDTKSHAMNRNTPDRKEGLSTLAIVVITSASVIAFVFVGWFTMLFVLMRHSTF